MVLPSNCAVCEHLDLEPRLTHNTVAVRTSAEAIVQRAFDRFDTSDTHDRHVVVPVCPEHAVDVFRGRIDGVEMAWHLS